jgi:spore germination protein GerM
MIGGSGVTKVTVTGTTGVFTVPVTGLTQSTSYSFKAYAINSLGATFTSVGTFTTLSTNADLNDLTLSNGTLSPTLASGTTNYTSSVVNVTSSITVTPTRAQANATIQVRVNGGSYTSVTSGSPSGLLVLNVGSNTVDVQVTAQDGLTQKIYTVTVLRMAAPTVTSPTATSITALGATLGGNLTSDGGTLITERGVVYAVTASNSNPLIGGSSVVKFTTTGTTGVFTVPVTGLTQGTGYSYKAYAINSQGSSYTSVGTFTTLSTNANLSNLTLSSGSLNPNFSSATTTYTTSVINPISAITLTPTRVQANATIAVRVNGGSYTSVTSGGPSSSLALNVGSNMVDVLVTAQDGLTQKTYTATVTRAKAPQTITFASIPDQLTTDVLNLTASGGGSGNPVTFTLTAGPASLVDNVLTFTTSGSVTITASQAGNANYLDAPNVVRTFTVSKATAPIAFSQTVQLANGTPRPVTVSTTPVGLSAVLSYAGAPSAPILPGAFEVIATIQDLIYQGTASTSLTVLGLTGSDFGRVTMGKVGAQTYSLSNPGLTAVALSGNPLVKILGEHASDFEVSVPPAQEIPPGGSVSFEIRFAPTQLGERQALVQLAFASPGNGPIDFPISGFGALATLKPQTLTFNLPASLHLSEGPLSLTASASSGLPVSFALISGPAVLQGNALTFSGPGIVQIEARQDGEGNYAAARPVRRSLTVKANPSGLTLSNLTQTYDGTPRPISVLGNVQTPAVSYTINNLSSTTPPTAAGNYPVSAFADGVLRRGTLVITRASLIVQPDDQSRHLGQTNPELTLTLTGMVPGEDPDNVLTRPISITTQAKESSPPGVYPITSSGGAAANYTLTHQPGTLVVEGYVGSFEALLRDPNSGLPAGLLKVTVPVASRSASARLMLGSEPAALSLAGPLTLNAASRVASGQFSRTLRRTDAYEVSLTISVFGELTAEVRRNAVLIAKSDDGIRLKDRTKGETVPQAGSYTGEIELARTAGPNDPFAPGWTTAKVDAGGTLAMTGRLGDATVFTASLPVDVAGGYRLFAQPYRPARAGAHVSGSWALEPHPTSEDRWQLAGAELTWVKAARDKDSTHRLGFGPLAVELSLSPWQPATRAIPLAQLLGAQQFAVAYSPTGSPSETSLPNQVGLNSNHTLQVLAPVTTPLNIRRWTARVNPTTGAFTGSFQLLDLTQSRTVRFSGVMRQSSNVLLGRQGAGHYLLPPLKGAANQESRTGDIRFMRLPE